VNFNEALLPWHVSQWSYLQETIKQERIPQALLINGIMGLGKRQLAEQYATALLCEHRRPDLLACGNCHSCLLLKANTHPDFISIEPETEEKAIGIETIRNLLPKLALKPQFEGVRVVLIHSAEQMNTASSNAFLKCLEEPSERTVIVLICANYRRLPATILSRCQHLALSKPAPSLGVAWLSSQGVQVDQAQLLNLAQGAPLLALSYAQANLLTTRNQCFTDWLKIAQRQIHPVAVAEQWQKLPLTSLLQWLISWVSDLIKSQHTHAEQYFDNQDLLKQLQMSSTKLEPKQLFALYDKVLEAQKLSHTTLNKQLLLEVILLHWYDLNYRR
jgi:DNA polymerase-3 subunit delta'